MKWAQGGKKQAWHHPACFKQRREELEIEPGLTGDMLNVSGAVCAGSGGAVWGGAVCSGWGCVGWAVCAD